MYPAHLKYTKDHEWIRIEGDTGSIGITNFAQQQLGDVVYVDLPEVGAQLTAGQTFGTIESVKAVSELCAPVSGEVVEVNTALKDKPEDVNAKPHDSWMIKVPSRTPPRPGT
jgi:glycine cleavage system H protein